MTTSQRIADYQQAILTIDELILDGRQSDIDRDCLLDEREDLLKAIAELKEEK